VSPAVEQGLTVAVTGPTDTFGAGLVPRLEDDDRVARVIGIARHPRYSGPEALRSTLEGDAPKA
jgi:hypothetical protein